MTRVESTRMSSVVQAGRCIRYAQSQRVLSTGNYRPSLLHRRSGGGGGGGDDFLLLMYSASAAATPREYYGEKRAKEEDRREKERRGCPMLSEESREITLSLTPRGSTKTASKARRV